MQAFEAVYNGISGTPIVRETTVLKFEGSGFWTDKGFFKCLDKSARTGNVTSFFTAKTKDEAYIWLAEMLSKDIVRTESLIDHYRELLKQGRIKLHEIKKAS